jgi:hypothetical protein
VREYDDTGRVVREVTVTEPEFDDEQVSWLLASEALEADIGPHGQPMSEATDPANEFAYKAPKRPVIDHAERARMSAADRYHKEWPDASRHGELWTVEKRPTA